MHLTEVVHHSSHVSARIVRNNRVMQTTCDHSRDCSQCQSFTFTDRVVFACFSCLHDNTVGCTWAQTSQRQAIVWTQKQNHSTTSYYIS